MGKPVMASGTFEAGPRNESCFRPFVPTPPPLETIAEALDLASDTIRQFERRLAAWDKPAVLGRLFARLDAVRSSGAEGSTTTFTDLLEYESSLKSAPDTPDAASIAALSDEASEEIDADPIDLARRFHHRLFERGTPRQAAEAGLLKARVNRVRDEDAPGGFFAYTRTESLELALAEWRDFTMARSSQLPELVRQCLSHWMFEHIHPFSDGNGRVGRLLVPVLLRMKGFSTTTCAFFSEPVYEDKDLYLDGLKFARTSNNMTSWMQLMLGFMHRNAASNLDRLDTLLDIKRSWADRLADHRSDSLIHRLAPFALTRPAFTVNDAMAEIGGTFASVNNAAARLVEKRILVIAKGSQRNRLFQAPEVLDAFDHFRTRRGL